MPAITFFAHSRRRVVAVFFGLLALLGMALHRDYGMSWDEPADRFNALVSAKYVALRLAPDLARRQPRLAEIPDLQHHHDADHGVLFLLPWVALEALWPGPGPAAWAYWRHLGCFLLFLAGAWAVYRLGAAHLRSWSWGLVGAAMLVLSPRLFAEAFYNTKDVVFLSLFSLAMLTLVGMLQGPSPGRALLHALATAAAVDVRIVGVVLPMLTVGFVALEAVYRPGSRRALAWTVAVYVPVVAVLAVLGWPYLWASPAANFLAAFQSLSHFDRLKEAQVFYLGRFESIYALPWHYAPVWLLITTPVHYVVLFVAGLGALARKVVLAGAGPCLRHAAGRRNLLLLAWLAGPLLGVVVAHSVLYDGWRHLYFVYPAFVLIAAQGLQALWRASGMGVLLSSFGRAGARLLLLGVALGTGQVVWRMVQEHPFQYAYFSFLPGHAVEQNFERDYWGLSTYQGLQWVLAHDGRPVVSVSMDERTALTLLINSKMLAPTDRARLRITSSAEADYYISIFRWHPGPYPASWGAPVHTIRVGGAAILTVLRRP